MMLRWVFLFHVGTVRFCVVSSRSVFCRVDCGVSWRIKCVCDVRNCIDCGGDGIFGCVSSLLFRSICLRGDWLVLCLILVLRCGVDLLSPFRADLIIPWSKYS